MANSSVIWKLDLPVNSVLWLLSNNVRLFSWVDIHEKNRVPSLFFGLPNTEIVSLRIFSVLSAILYLGNVTYQIKSSGRDEGLEVGPPEVLATLSDLLKVTFLTAATCSSATGCLRESALTLVASLRSRRSCWWRRWPRGKRWQSTTR